jgi:hypothetical protein
VTSISTNRNHTLNTRKARYFRCGRNLDLVIKGKLEINDRAETSMSKNYNSLAVEAFRGI